MNDQRKLPLETDARTQKARRRQGGVSTTELIFSSHLGDNAGIFPDILALHVPKGSVVADITYGRGVFWKNVDRKDYTLLPSDLKTGVDWTDLPYAAGSADAVVFDPPYMEGLYRKSKESLAGAGTHQTFQNAYSNGAAQSLRKVRKYHDAVLETYLSVLPEVKRVLRPSGKFIVKCQDEVSANLQKLTHVELIWAYEKRGFYCQDLFIVVRRNAPVVSRLKKQKHARKNHSYFLIFKREDHQKKISYSNFADWLRE